MTESAIRQALDKTQVFAERQRLFKELWRIQREAAAHAKRDKQRELVGVTKA